MTKYRQGLFAGVASLALVAAAGLAYAQSPGGGTTSDQQQSAQPPTGKGSAMKPGGSGMSKKGSAMQMHSHGSSSQAQNAGQGMEPKGTEQGTQNPAEEKSGSSADNATKGTDQNAQNNEHNGAQSSAQTKMRPNHAHAQRTNRHEHGVAHNERGMRRGRHTTAQRQQPSSEGQRNASGQMQGNKAAQSTAETHGANGQAKGASVTLNEQQRTRIRETIIDAHNAPRVGHVDFNVAVGTVIPRAQFTTVHVVPVPEYLVTIQPEWRGFEYFVYEDEVVIIDPHDFTIIAIVNV
jgi:Protein of unknown function (DUF1236)